MKMLKMSILDLLIVILSTHVLVRLLRLKE
jgi:hypothetical protein